MTSYKVVGKDSKVGLEKFAVEIEGEDQMMLAIQKLRDAGYATVSATKIVPKETK